jgi:RNA polymerase sigma-70 factor (ECF subfamily)
MMHSEELALNHRSVHPPAALDDIGRRDFLPEEVPDEAIVARVRAGELERFEVLMRRYNQRVYRTARAVLRDDRDAEEVTQETWAKAFAHLESFAGRSRFSTWLTRIAIHEAIHRDRARRRTAYVAIDSSRVSPTSYGASAEQSALDDELRRALEAAVETLPDTYRTTFVLREIEDLSTGETAECLGIPEETVKTRLHRARAFLRHKLEKRFGTDLRDSFRFLGGRCDRMVAVVLARIGAPPAIAGRPDGQGPADAQPSGGTGTVTAGCSAPPSTS